MSKKVTSRKVENEDMSVYELSQLMIKQFDKVWAEFGNVKSDIHDVKKEILLVRTDISIIEKRLTALEIKIDPDSNLKNEVNDLREKLNHVYTILKNNGIQIA